MHGAYFSHARVQYIMKGELNKEATVSKMEIVQEEGGTRKVKRSTDFYSLNATIFVVHRVSVALEVINP